MNNPPVSLITLRDYFAGHALSFIAAEAPSKISPPRPKPSKAASKMKIGFQSALKAAELGAPEDEMAKLQTTLLEYEGYDNLAKKAYQLADALLAAREPQS